MAKLPEEHQFIDISDYGRPVARVIAKSLKQTNFTPIDVTIAFIIAGLLAISCIFLDYLWAFLCIQLQGTLYNYYYVILRNRFNGDTTSRIFEDSAPIALAGEKQKNVNLLFAMYNLLYKYFDKTIYLLDRNAIDGKLLPNWLMTGVSALGLGSQLLIISIMLVLGLKEFIIPFFIFYSSLIFIFIGIRKTL